RRVLFRSLKSNVVLLVIDTEKDPLGSVATSARPVDVLITVTPPSPLPSVSSTLPRKVCAVTWKETPIQSNSTLYIILFFIESHISRYQILYCRSGNPKQFPHRLS